ncbi:MAG: Asp-tRNA(Asn)/Glu-tRNA(Gln) amidotransferase subunit GatC [Holosporales bacterium]|jgi:aspartyl-tRNA(Asn)/glutamyl-tRNA(Gln) amidotransferase subunit C|nr:Asp-tRNA(Asn)/Glu-tRNA(Gln) amidotransferase subunit GatC [Holosporales bacterium]
MSAITHEDVRKIATLARIHIEGREGDSIVQEISGILTFVEQLNRLDPVLSSVGVSMDQQTPQRPDEVLLTNTSEELLSNAPAAAFGMFEVPKVVE